jgi:hypothetical protein
LRLLLLLSRLPLSLLLPLRQVLQRQVLLLLQQVAGLWVPVVP